MTYLVDHVKEFAGLLPRNSILLDIGCGNKPYFRLFENCINYMGVDAFISGRTFQNKKPDLFFNGKHLPLNNNSVDAILCTQVLEHASDLYDLMQEIYRVMKPGAIGLITVPFMWGEHETPYDFRRFTSFGIKKFITDNGFCVIDQNKCCLGVKAIQTIIFSEFDNYKDNIRLTKTKWDKIKFQIIDKISHKFILLLMKLLNKFYVFERIYIDNAIIFKK